MSVTSILQFLFILISILLAVQDIKEKKISLLFLVFILIISITFRILKNDIDYMSIYAIYPGILFIVVALLLPDQIGLGDGIYILSIGIMTNYMIINFVVIFAIVLLIIYVGIRFIKTRNNNNKIAFIPFLVISYMTVNLIGV